MSQQLDFDYISKEYNRDRSAAGSDVICALMQFHTGKPLKSLHVLDAGSGTGNYAKALIDYGVEYVTLLDGSSSMLEVATEKLIDDIKAGAIKDIVQCNMPPIPFHDSSFDAVLVNGDLATCLEILKEARRVLRSGGVILISAILQPTAEQNMWPVKLDKTLGERYIQMLMSLRQYEDLFQDADISCIQKMNILGSDIFPNYHKHPEDYLNNFLFIVSATEAERHAMLKAVVELKQKGEIAKWIKEHDCVDTAGLLTLFVCKAKPEKVI